MISSSVDSGLAGCEVSVALYLSSDASSAVDTSSGVCVVSQPNSAIKKKEFNLSLNILEYNCPSIGVWQFVRQVVEWI